MTACQTLFLEASKRSDFDHVAELRFQMASKLFYKTLISLLQLEQNEDSSSELSALLQMAKFLKSLLACCIEVVMATYNNSCEQYGMLTGSFEWILRVFNLHGFDLFRVLGSFLKAETQLPSSVAKHLQNVEDEIILHVVWKAESPLFDTLLSNRDDEELQNQQLPWLQSNSLSLFFVKACRLAHHRMSILCGHLDLNSDLQKQIWSCIETCICHRTKILQDRHLDQVIMCALYGVCKIREKDITFRSIVKKYLLLPHSSSQVYRHVAMPDEAASSIISFYNQIFMQQLKDHLVAISTPSPQVSDLLEMKALNELSSFQRGLPQ
ncbi:hypothetical protein CAPTEDRAFT_132839 [Capitella teleta]|uniref:Retinoblastoma-associated protein A-box domain-containing protein n=1 Tax=Capitella teleta TaxID=283909 RepID=R7U2C1_CAPTE|nr:hypothetical protein CAPTEDRAFT_132839 [Capitella teleta]|eukprot:ELT97791.1 hypothetical protein CAPTEDRAFT_132839 [Capitella teleta]